MRKWLTITGIIGVVAIGAPVMPQASDANSLNTGSSRSSRSSRSSSRGSSRDASSTGNGSTGETVNDRERRRESRLKERESNSRSSSRKEKTGNATEPAKPGEPAKDTKSVKGAKPASTGGKGSSGGGRKPVEIKFEMQADPETNIMYLETVTDTPSLNASVLEKKKFVTRLALYNAKGSEFSQVDASIKYDPQLVKPVGIDDGSIRSNLQGPARVAVDKNSGIVSFSADFAQPRSDSFLTLSKIQWEALEPTAATPLRFLNTQNHPSGVFNAEGENILHMRTDGTVESSANAGLLDATVSIEPTNGTVELAQEGGNPFSAVALATNINSGTAEGGIQLYLKPRRPVVGLGEEFLVDVMYRNPKRADMDTVKLKLRFDPEVLQVVDYDEGNWITRGVNVFDGAYHEELPFDYHRKNAAFNTTGIIEYDNGFGSQVPVSEEGVIATIRFKAVQPAVSTPIVFVTNPEDAMNPDTSISFLGFNLIGVPGKRQQALSNASISVSAR